MKIIHLIFSLPNAGKENLLVDIANEQFNCNNKVGIVVVNNYLDKAVKERINVGVRLFQLNRTRSSKNIFPLIKLFLIIKREFKPDVIHIHDPELGRLIRLFSKIPIVLTVHNTKMDVKPMRIFNRIFAISKAVKLDIESYGNLSCKVICNGIKIEEIVKKTDFVIPEIYKVILVKRLDHIVKGQDILLKSINTLIYKKGIRNIKLFLVGDGKSQEFIKQLIDDLDLQDYVVLLGNQSREWVYQNLHKYDLFIHPSRIEGFGLTVVEAMAAKVPVISSNIEGPAEILENGKYGILFENDNHEDLARQIVNIIGLYETGEISKMVESAYEHCVGNFNITRTAREYCESYL